MMETSQFGAVLKELGFDFYSGVPCSYLKSLINFSINECEYVMANNEGDAIAIAAGAFLGGRKAVVLMQNSGLTNAISPLTSLIHPFKIPILGFVSLRGEPGFPDEPQHELMGQITPKLLTSMQIEWDYLSTDLEEAKQQLQIANNYIEQNKAYFFVVRKGTFDSIALIEKPKQKIPIQKEKREKVKEDEVPNRFEVLALISSLRDDDTVYLATTGKTGRELYEVEDAANNFYMVGSMGCISSIGLGLSLTRKDKSIIALDGDGALLMRMGNLATNGYYAPENLLHILLDNHTHDSTGGQFTVSPNVNFVDTAFACGYEQSIYVHNLKELEEGIQEWKENPRLTFLYVKIAEGSKKNLGRPKVKPFEVKERLQVFLNG
ncbi:phosphonopyruvate decarboxylase [Oceanobacillus chungangensis]|uniref:Phosphonopyruvate decarboxylase n=1 Tax=Oceanobacillus chungangensis TaxID=1229152 RepID=A0A3D8PXB4_9BACI|nr:phosphonopyruvate decarboxylase [Oceanobacillus chungangensis]RDW20733.1 phosphonopyruvate decarboxylase [Oceanobacillus chungangensis]